MYTSADVYARVSHRDAYLPERGLAAEVHVHAAALYVAMIKNGFFDEATEFAEWYLETFDHDLED